MSACDRAVRIAAGATQVLEVDLVVLDPADGEREVELQRADLRVDLVRRAEVDRCELAEDLVPLSDVALVEAIVGLDRRTGDAVQLEERRLQLTGPDLDEVRHSVSSRGGAGTGGAYPCPDETRIERRRQAWRTAFPI